MCFLCVADLMFVSRIHMSKPQPQCIWRWDICEVIRFRWVHDGGAPLVIISLWKEEIAFSATWAYSRTKCSHLQARKQIFTRNQICQCYLDPECPSLDILGELGEMNACYFKSASVWYFVIAPRWLKHRGNDQYVKLISPYIYCLAHEFSCK